MKCDVKVKVHILWDIMSWWLVNSYQYFAGAFCFHLQSLLGWLRPCRWRQQAPL